jgi:uncharacterized membrane protein
MRKETEEKRKTENEKVLAFLSRTSKNRKPKTRKKANEIRKRKPKKTENEKKEIRTVTIRFLFSFNSAVAFFLCDFSKLHFH